MPARTLFVALALVAVSCTGGSSTTIAPSPPVGGSPPPSVNVQATIVPGVWTYDLRGLKATFTWKEGVQPTLGVKNASGAEVGAPAIYVVTQEQKRVDGSIDSAQPIADGGSGDYSVTFPSDLQRDDVGLVVLELGDENYGALAPKVVEGT